MAFSESTSSRYDDSFVTNPARPEESETKDNRLLSIISINISAFAAVGIASSFKMAAENDVTVGDFQVYRAALMFIVMGPLTFMLGNQPCRDLKARGTGGLPATDRQRALTMCLRSLFGVLNFVLYIWVTKMIPIALATILFNLAPFWTSFMGYFINGEQIYMFQYFAMAVCLVLIVCLTLTKDSPDANVDNTTSDTMMGITISILGSINGAAMNISNRRLQGTHFSVVMFFHSALGFTIPLVITLLFCAITGTTFFQYDAAGWTWLTIGALCDLVGCIFNVIAFQNDESAFIAVVQYSQVFYAFVVDIVAFNQGITGLQLVLALSIMAATCSVAVYKLLKSESE